MNKKKIIIHFEEYLLLTQKRADYDLFKKVVFMLDNKEHLTQKGLREIVMIRALHQIKVYLMNLKLLSLIYFQLRDH